MAKEDCVSFAKVDWTFWGTGDWTFSAMKGYIIYATSMLLQTRRTILSLPRCVITLRFVSLPSNDTNFAREDWKLFCPRRNGPFCPIKEWAFLPN